MLRFLWEICTTFSKRERKQLRLVAMKQTMPGKASLPSSKGPLRSWASESHLCLWAAPFLSTAPSQASKALLAWSEAGKNSVSPYSVYFGTIPLDYLFISLWVTAKWQLTDTRLFLQIPLQRQKYNINLAICLLPWQQLSGTIKIPFHFLLWQQPETHSAWNDGLLVPFF